MSYARTALLLATLTALFVAIGYGLGGLEGGTGALALAAAVNLWCWWRAGDAILTAHGAREVDVADEPNLIGLVRVTAARAGVPPPRVYLTDCPQPNAFAVGRNPHHAALVISETLRKHLTRDELGAVIGHELAHIRLRDTLLMTIAATFVGAVVVFGAVLALIGWSERRTGGLPLVALGIAAPVAAIVLQFAISREREYAADRFSAERGDPRSLISALKKLAHSVERIENPSALCHPATARLFFVDPFPRLPLGRLFASHPSIAARIARLEALALGLAPPCRGLRGA